MIAVPAFFRERRWQVSGLLAALLLAALATYWLWPTPVEVPAAKPPPSPGAPIGSLAQTGPAPAPAVAVQAPSEPVDIFAVRNWEPPPPPPVAVAAAPPLPFRYLGKVEEAGRAPVFFLIRDERMLAVHPGQVIDGTYQVGKYEDGRLAFLYRPMKIRQFLSVGGNS